MKRGQYWTAMIIHLVILLVPLYPLVRNLTGGSAQLSAAYISWVLPLWCFYFLLTRIPVLSAAVRRLHTLPRSGWSLLIGLLPVIGWIILIIWLLQEGTYEQAVKKLGEHLGLPLKVDYSPKKGGWFFVVFLILVVCGNSINKNIRKSGKADEILMAVRNGGISGLVRSGKADDSADLPVYLIEAGGERTVTARRDGSELVLVQDGLLASKYEVSYEQYIACVRDNGCVMPEAVTVDAYRDLETNLFRIIRDNSSNSIPIWFSVIGQNSLSYYAADKPMVDVTVEQAAAYCTWAGMRLPTAAEWKAAAAGSKLDPERSNCSLTDRTSWFTSRPQAKAQLALTVPVTAFSDSPSDQGLVQMAGNVWEWVAPEKDPGTVLALGGGWNSYPGEAAEKLSYEARSGYAANNIGFRCFVDSSALTSDLFSDGETVVPETVITPEVVTAEPVEEETAAAAEAEVIAPEATEAPAVEPSPTADIIYSVLLEEAAFTPEPTAAAETAVPTEKPTPVEGSGIRMEEDSTVLSRRDGSLLRLTENNVLASVYAVTVGQYDKCVQDGACEASDGLTKYAYWVSEDNDELPMVNVTRDQASAYCAWTGMRLPTAREWRTAAKTWETSAVTADAANCVGTDRSAYITEVRPAMTVPVKAFSSEASLFGMVQMFGNVWEWTAGESADLAQALGGGWNSYPGDLGPDAALETSAGYSANNIGFRCFVDWAKLTEEWFSVVETEPDGTVPEAAVPESPVIEEPVSEEGTQEKPEPQPVGNIREKDQAQMVFIPGASFKMGVAGGAIDEKPVHDVLLSPYRIDIYEVTTAQYAQCVEDGACSEPAQTGSFRNTVYYGNPEYADYPVINVTWDQASAYCEWAGGRLPTEAEWEYAAKGDEGYTYPWGNTFASENLNFSGSGNYDVVRVDANPKDLSPFGLYDMGGNAAEWVFDCYQENWYSVTNQPVDPKGPEAGGYHVVRGSSAQRPQDFARTAKRFFAPHSQYSADRGFRCVVPGAE
ncbi:MAG: SUMF1/EgtB/PvdO family nonheme iron enzyme [Anaerolineaceae bacterium]|nr:SUMF1/EgtB/PvdO family nonheme iron enzyme [Anaerolineaceae bacterium]